MASSRKAPKKAEKAPAKKAPAKATAKAKTASKPEPAKKAAAPAPKASSPRPPTATPAKPAPAASQEPVADPEFVKRASFAERKAALEAALEAAGVPLPSPAAPAADPAPPKPPAFVREVSPAERKAVVERIVEESGIAGALSKAPWKRSAPAPVPAPAAPADAPPQRTSPKMQMTKAPLVPEAGKSPPRVVILDTNALMMQFQFHVDIEREVRRILNFNYEIVIPQIVVSELERLAREGNGKEQGEARMAAELAKTFKVVESPGDGDTGLLRLAEKLNAVVVTNDKVLRARLRAKDIPNIYMRSRAFLTIEGHIPGM